VQSTILIYGKHPTLLRTRSLILEKDGFRVARTNNLADAIQQILTQEVALLILCQSLSNEERRRSILMANAVRPPMKILVMLPDQEIDLFGDTTKPMEPLVHSEIFLNVVKEMLSHQSVIENSSHGTIHA
jgi:hypothetical protein